ncbi:DUF1622 domain-containing protein [Lysobacter sp. TAF61]|uniref:DUF1622 domain-containing protein n=1 Tax=Lysobacter sp. TAF61 TaxID=3233072 RepID=UPI003F9B8D08
MEEWLVRITEPVVVAIDFIALLIILAGTLQAIAGVIRLLTSHRQDNHERRRIWMDYSRWLVAALTFQLAADILESSTTPDWDGIGRLAAVAVIRTFLNYFLERDVEEMRQREEASRERTGVK